MTHGALGRVVPTAFLPGEGTGCLASDPRQTRVYRRPCIHASAASAGTGPGLRPTLYSSAFCNPVVMTDTHPHTVEMTLAGHTFNASADELEQDVTPAAKRRLDLIH